jgi:hypothetical protein
VLSVEERGLVVELLLPREGVGLERPSGGRLREVDVSAPAEPLVDDDVPMSLPEAAPGVPVVLLPTLPDPVVLWPLELALGVPIVELLDPVVLWSVPSVPLAPVVVEPL